MHKSTFLGSYVMDGPVRHRDRHKVRQKRLSRLTYRLFELGQESSHFLIALLCLAGVGYWLARYPFLAQWYGFLLSSYAVIGNDSIQALGLFLSVKGEPKRPWWLMWGFMAGLFALTMLYSWRQYGGDVSYGRLQAAGLAGTDQLSLSQILAPLLLLLLTRLRIPISTTFLLINLFSQKEQLAWQMVRKSCLAYSAAFLVSCCLWYSIGRLGLLDFQGRPRKIWSPLHWIGCGLLWVSWWVQDGSNMAVFLPRRLSAEAFLGFLLIITASLGLIFIRYGKVRQYRVSDRPVSTDVRSAASVALVYMALLTCFTQWNQLPMSTTWLFIGLLGGRELAKGLQAEGPTRQASLLKSFYVINRDLFYAGLGLACSLLLAYLLNPAMGG